MGDPRYSEIVSQATTLLARGDSDAAIDVLRADGPPNDADLCAFLARAYYQRGDARGDVFASHYFARRALQLGSYDPGVAAIQAVAAFRRGDYEEALEVFERQVTDSSPP